MTNIASTHEDLKQKYLANQPERSCVTWSMWSKNLQTASDEIQKLTLTELEHEENEIKKNDNIVVVNESASTNTKKAKFTREKKPLVSAIESRIDEIAKYKKNQQLSATTNTITNFMLKKKPN
jgi:hypothetical protein